MKLPETCLSFADRAEWRAWLEANHAGRKEAWLVHYKKGAGKAGLSYEEAVEEALCFGWIDGLLRRLDEERYLLRYTPRRPGSVWAASNLQRVEKLVAEGRMTQAGLDRIAEARRSGEWDAAARREDVDALPPELARALQADERAEAWFRGLPASRKKQLIWWVTSAKRQETRDKRVRAVLDMVAD